MRTRLTAASALVLAAAVVAASGCGGRRGGRGVVDSGTPPADGGPARDGGGERDGGPPPDGGGGDAGPVDAGRDAAEPPTVDVTGSWSGTWSSAGLSDTATATLVQSGSTVAGLISLNGSPCVTEGSVEATIMGGDVAGTFSGETDTASFTATATSSTLVGSFTVETGTCAGVGGTFDMTR